jgi:hypothetical protein
MLAVQSANRVAHTISSHFDCLCRLLRHPNGCFYSVDQFDVRSGERESGMPQPRDSMQEIQVPPSGAQGRIGAAFLRFNSAIDATQRFNRPCLRFGNFRPKHQPIRWPHNLRISFPRSGIAEEPAESLSLRPDSGRERFIHAGSTAPSRSNVERACARHYRHTPGHSSAGSVRRSRRLGEYSGDQLYRQDGRHGQHQLIERCQ